MVLEPHYKPRLAKVKTTQGQAAVIPSIRTHDRPQIVDWVIPINWIQYKLVYQDIGSS